MGLDLLAAGGGAGQGLEDYLAQQITQERLDEEKRHNQAQEAYQTRALDQNDQLRRDTLNFNQREKHDTGIEKRVGMRSIGDPVTEQEFNEETGDSGPGLPTGLYKITPPQVPTSITGYASMPGDLQPSAAVRQTPDASSPIPTAPRAIVFQGTGAQRAAATKEQDLEGSRAATLQQKIDDATQRANEAWERLRQQGENADAMAALHQSQQEIGRLNLQLQEEKTNAANAKTPQPQMFLDKQGNWHAAIYDKGKMTEVPMPAGWTPTKTAPQGMWDRITSMFNGPSTLTDPTDPNWGKP